MVIVRVTDYQGVYQEYELPLDDTFTLHLPWDFSLDVGGEHFEAHKEALVELEWADE